ncbi:MAG TPA: hypothetical protein VHK22_03090 [Gaiellaceae bacterium]|nr:hypothetical protein [Gaiellaceae bacterium]
MRRIALLAAVMTLAAGCGGETQTVTVTAPADTVTETVTETVRDDDGVEAMAAALCREYGPLARTFGGLSTDDEVADELAEDVEPELRDAARRGCLAGLRSG